MTAFLSPETGAAVRAEHGPADLVVANNVYAHIPDVLGFTEGLRALVADDGWVSIEVQHLLTLVQHTQFDTIYHEHFQYYTVGTAQRALAAGGLTLVDVELLPTHGGSIRLWARPSEVGAGLSEIGHGPSGAVTEVLAQERAAGLATVEGHAGFARAVDRVCAGLLRFLLDARAEVKPSWSAKRATRTSTPDGPQPSPGNDHWRAVCAERRPYRSGRGRRFARGSRELKGSRWEPEGVHLLRGDSWLS